MGTKIDSSSTRITDDLPTPYPQAVFAHPFEVMAVLYVQYMLPRREFLMGTTGAAFAGSSAWNWNQKLTAEEGEDKLVGTHYYTWYGPDNHWDEGYVGTPKLGEYDSGDPEVISQHIEWAENHGINWFNVTWWGPDSYSAQTLEQNLAPGIIGSNVEFSVLYEPKGRLEYEDYIADLDQRGNRETLARDLEHIAKTLTDNPNYLHIDGKPVIYVYVANTLSGDIQAAFADAEQRAGSEFFLIGDYGRRPQLPNSVFDAISPYNMYRPIEDTTSTFTEFVDQAFQRWSLLSREMDFTFVPNVLPGFNNTKAEWAPDGMPVLERSPEQYREICRIARKYMDDTREMALITSFNEWHEYTSIEPAEEFDDTYLAITKKDLADADLLSPDQDLVSLTFHWRDYVLESSVNPDVEEGTGRQLTIAIDSLELRDADGESIRSYDIGGENEPIYTQGVSHPGSHDGKTWRWLTANREMVSNIYIPQNVATETQEVAFLCRALKDNFRFSLSLGSSDERTEISADRGWNSISTRLQGQQTATPTEKPDTETATSTSVTTGSPTTVDTTETVATTTGGETDTANTTESAVSSPGFGIAAGASSIGIASLYAIYNRKRREASDE